MADEPIKETPKTFLQELMANKEALGLFIKGGVYLTLLIIMFILGKTSMIEQVAYLENACPCMDYGGNIFQLDAQPNNTSLNMTGVFYGGTGQG